jgi:hypothetical protein
VSFQLVQENGLSTFRNLKEKKIQEEIDFFQAIFLFNGFNAF